MAEIVEDLPPSPNYDLGEPNLPRENPNFDEEANARNDFHIETIVNGFVDGEESIRHDVIPDIVERGFTGNGTAFFEGEIGRGDGTMFKGQTFYNGIAFKESVTDYALHTGYNLRQYKYERTRIGFRCVGGENKTCTWKVYASSLPKDPTWRIRVFENKHTCIPNGRCEMFRSPVIARLFVDKIRDEPDYYYPAKIEEIIRERWKITVTRNLCQSARNKALRWIEVEYDHQFNRLRDYAAEIMESNKDSIVHIDTTSNKDGLNLFNRFYVCFDVLRRTWKDTCRPLIGVDGCFLKAKVKGQLLVALGRDADNGIYPIAWSVVQVENKENWLWFVNRLKIDLGLGDGSGYVMVSDRQKGLIAAVEKELPMMEHIHCVRHIYNNIKKNHPGKLQLKPLIWTLAWSYNEKQYQERLERIRCYDTKVYEDILKAKPKTWCRAFYKLGSFCEDVDNNSTESFNKPINKAREKPFVAMLETVRRLAMVRIAKRSAISHSHEGLCTPYVTRFLAQEHEQASVCKVSNSTNGMFEVVLGGDTHRISLRAYTCTCKKYQICGIPCEHAYGVILAKKLVVENYVCQWFQSAMWRRNYTDGLIPQRGPRFWPSTEAENIYPPPAPAKSGRNKVTKADKTRKRGECESPTKKAPKEKKRNMHCSICKSDKHNKRRHGVGASGNESSQVQDAPQSSQAQSQVQDAPQSSQAQSQIFDPTIGF